MFLATAAAAAATTITTDVCSECGFSDASSWVAVGELGGYGDKFADDEDESGWLLSEEDAQDVLSGQLLLSPIASTRTISTNSRSGTGTSTSSERW